MERIFDCGTPILPQMYGTIKSVVHGNINFTISRVAQADMEYRIDGVTDLNLDLTILANIQRNMHSGIIRVLLLDGNVRSRWNIMGNVDGVTMWAVLIDIHYLILRLFSGLVDVLKIGLNSLS